MQPKRDETVKRVGKSKVTKLKAKADIVYPLIRLPKTYEDEIGNTAEIFETTDYNKRGLFICFEDDAQVSEVIQKSNQVIQPDSPQDIQNRISQLESQFSKFKSLILEKASYNDSESKKGAPESGFEPESEPRQGSAQAKLASARSARSL